MKTKSVAFTLLLCFLTFNVAADCYITVEKAASQNEEMLQSQAETYLTQFVEKVLPIPYGGISSNDCLYKISLMENREGFFVTISGDHLNSDGFSQETGFAGVKQAMLRAIYKVMPEQQETICDIHKNILWEECGGTRPETFSEAESPKETKQPALQVPLQPPRKPGPCAEEFKQVCDMPRGPEHLACLRKNSDQLSKECRQILRKLKKIRKIEQNRALESADAKAAREACKQDVQAYCGEALGIPQDLQQCMREHRRELSPACRKALRRLRRQ